MLGYGQDIVTARKLHFVELGQFSASTTVTPNVRFGVPVGYPDLRILGIHFLASGTVPSDTDGALTINALANDVSEGAADTLVSAEDIEALVTATEQLFEATLAADGTEEIRTLAPGDVIRFQLVNDSAAVDQNPQMYAAVEYILVPRRLTDEDEPPYVDYPSNQTKF